MTMKGAILTAFVYIVAIPLVSLYFLKVALTSNVKYFETSALIQQKLSLALIEKKDIVSSCDMLSMSVREKLFQFFIIQLNGHAICSEPEKWRHDIDLPYVNIGKTITSGRWTFRSEQRGPYLITVGYFNDSLESFLAMLKSDIKDQLIQLLVIIFLNLILFKILSAPLRGISNKLSKTQDEKSNILEKIGQTKESLQIQAAAQAYDKKVSNLSQEIEIAVKDFSLSLVKKAQKENKHLPIKLDGTILRIDLNDYTRMFFDNNKLVIDQIMTEIASDVFEMTNRYQGLHYAFGGDEFIEFFHGKDSLLRAFFCTRSIFEATEQLNLPENIKEQVFFKASLGFEKDILFSRRPGFYALTSEALIFTARYFSAYKFENKKENSLLTGNSERQILDEFGSFCSPEPYQLKNIEGPQNISRLLSFLSLDEVILKQDDLLLTHFRSNQDIITLFEALLSVDNHFCHKILQHLKTFTVQSAPSDLVSKWTEVLLILDKRNIQDFNLISSHISCGRNLIPKKLWTLDISNLISSLSSISNDRVLANLIQLLDHMNDHQAIEKLRRVYDSDLWSRRAKGLSLVADCKLELSQNNILKLSNLIYSDNDQDVTTGIYCLSQIVRYYKKKDPIFLSQFLEINNMLKHLEVLMSSQTDFIRTRAFEEIQNIKAEV